MPVGHRWVGAAGLACPISGFGVGTWSDDSFDRW